MTELPDEIIQDLNEILSTLQELAVRLEQLIHNPIPPR